jgi:transposase-like protein
MGKGLKRKLTPAQAAEAVALVEEGRTYAHVAKLYGVSVACIRWHCLRQGAPPRGKLQPPPANPVVMRRGDHQVRLFTAEEDASLLRLEAEGLRTSEIARRLGRKPNSVTGRLATIARHQEHADA